MVLLILACSIAYADVVSFGKGLDFYSGLTYHRVTSFAPSLYVLGFIKLFVLSLIILIGLSIVMKINKVDKKIRRTVLVIIIILFVGFEVFALIRGIRIAYKSRESYEPGLNILQINAYNQRYLQFTGANMSASDVRALIQLCKANNTNDDIIQTYGMVSIVLKDFDSEGITARPQVTVRTTDELKAKSVEIEGEDLIKNTDRYYIDVSAYYMYGGVSEITIYKQKGMITE